MRNIEDEPSVAIIGMSCRFPGAADVDEFWHLLRDGREAISFPSDDELESAGVPRHVRNDPAYVRASGVLAGADLFDAEFFGFSPREAELTDPQHRVFLECAWAALEDAGYGGVQRGPVGVFAGAGWNSYLLRNLAADPNLLESIGHQVLLGNEKDHLATRVSYKLNLTGPSLTVQTGCSTSLAAVALAYQSLLAHQTDLALAGGVSITIPQGGYRYVPGGILSRDGRCRPFDAKASGTVIGSGAGVVVLKRLAEAAADGDHVYAVIRAVATNNDGGSKVGYTAPSVDGQARVILEALTIADVEPDSIAYVEAHGTGTELGDPVEVAALTKAFRSGTARRGFCRLGSVKSNIGHLDAAAGVAGLIKTALSLEHREIPPSLNFEVPNPQIAFAQSPFLVATGLTRWETTGEPRRAGVSSFGLGGTNVHAVLEEAPVALPNEPAGSTEALVISARNGEALERATKGLSEHLRRHPRLDLSDVAYTLQVGRRAFAHRRVVVCDRVDEAVALLEREDPGRVSTAVATEAPAVAFLFPGRAFAWSGVVRTMYRTQPAFRDPARRCLDILSEQHGLELESVLRGDAGSDARAKALPRHVLDAASFLVEYSLARAWVAWGVEVRAALGIGLGQLVAAALSGVFSLDDAIALSLLRGRAAAPGAGNTHLEARTAFDAALALARPREPRIPLLCGETGAWVDAGIVRNSEHWLGSKHAPNRLGASLRARDNRLLLEIGPRAEIFELSSDAVEGVLAGSLDLTETSAGDEPFLRSVGRLWAAGVDVDWVAISKPGRRRIRLPTYPFIRKRYWFGPTGEGALDGHAPAPGSTWKHFEDSFVRAASASFVGFDEAGYRAGRKLLERLALDYMRAAARRLAPLAGSGGDGEGQGPADVRGISPRFHQLFTHIHAVLAEQDDASRRDAGSAHSEPRGEEGPEAAFVRRCGEALPQVLLGQLDPLDLFHSMLGDDGSHPREVLEPYYARTIRDALSWFLEAQNSSKPIRVLEVGGGTGLLTREILDVLRPGRASYTFTDASRHFLTRARRELKSFPFVDYRLLDLERAPRTQGFEEHAQDVIVAVNVLHVTRSVDEALEHLRSLLAPGGLLIVWELTRRTPDFEVTYGLLMKGLSDGERTQGNPFLSRDAWCRALRAHGFPTTRAFPDDERFHQHIIVAQTPESPPPGGSSPTPVPSPLPGLVKKSDLAAWFHVPSWKRGPPAADRAGAGDCFVIFLDAAGIGAMLSRKLVASSCRVFTVESGEEYRFHPGGAVVNLREKEHYRALLRDWRDQFALPARVLWLRGLSIEAGTLAHDAEFEAFQGLLTLAQAVGEMASDETSDLTVVSSHLHQVIGDEVTSAEKALTVAVCRVLPLEAPGVACRSIDVVLDPTRSLEEVSTQLLRELLYASPDAVVALRGYQRWIPAAEPVPLERDAGRGRLKQGGVYLITGGLGEIGLAIAERLGRTLAAKLVLTSRRRFPDRAVWDEWISAHDDADPCSKVLRKVRELESLGAQVLIASADVAAIDEMRTVIATAERRFGQIDGVIHSAGVLGDCTIQRQTRADVEAVLRPKVRGTLVLDELFKGRQLDLFVLFSSLSASKPAFGQVAYSAANAFLESFASKVGPSTMFISWDVWQGKGMAYDANVPRALARLRDRDFASRGITKDEGAEIFVRAMASPWPHLLVCTTDYLRSDTFELPRVYLEELNKRDTFGERQRRPALSTPFCVPGSESEAALAEIWEELLGIDGIGVDDDFFELGGDSLVGTQLTARVSERFGLVIPVRDIYSLCTIRQMASAIEERLVAGASADQLLEIIEKLPHS